MRRFWSEPAATTANRVPSGERIAEDPLAVYRVASAPISALKRIGCCGFGARSTNPIANAIAISASAAAAPQTNRSRQFLVADVALTATAVGEALRPS